MSDVTYKVGPYRTINDRFPDGDEGMTLTGNEVFYDLLFPLIREYGVAGLDLHDVAGEHVATIRLWDWSVADDKVFLGREHEEGEFVGRFRVGGPIRAKVDG